jgi:hypothetical protein
VRACALHERCDSVFPYPYPILILILILIPEFLLRRSFSAVFFRRLFPPVLLILILIPSFFLRRSFSARCLFRILILMLILVPHVSVGSGRHFAREFLGGRRWRWVRWTRHRSFHRVACKATLFHRGDELSTLNHQNRWNQRPNFAVDLAVGRLSAPMQADSTRRCAFASLPGTIVML